MKRANLAVGKIRRDSGAQFRDALSESHIGNMVEALRDGAPLPPVDVFFDGRDHWLADGEHRLEAHERAGRDEIVAHVRDGSQLDARRFGRGANATHGLPRSVKAKRAQVLDALSDPERTSWSDREIAKECKVSHPFVAQMRNEKKSESGNVTTSSEIPTEQITPIYEAPGFAEQFPLSLLSDAGVDLSRAGVEWFGMSKEHGSITIYPDGMSEGFWSLSVVSPTTRHTTVEPIPTPMIVCQLESLGVSQEKLKTYRFEPIESHHRHAIAKAANKLIDSTLEVARTVRANSASIEDASVALLLDFERKAKAGNRDYYSLGYLSGLALDAMTKISPELLCSAGQGGNVTTSSA
jgi:hypothetical protein